MSCEGALVSAQDTQLAFSGSVSDPAGLSGPLKVSLTRAGATVLTDTAQRSGRTWSWTWDTSGLTDDGAAYTFVVAATNTLGQTTTVARTVWVDRQAPSQTTRLPAPNAVDVWPLRQIQLTFSERLLPSSVKDSAVTVLSNGAITVSKRLSLSPDGRTLSIKLLTPPTVGGQLKVSFAASGLTDLLGNALTSPSTPWQWSVAPIWVELAQMNTGPSKYPYYTYYSVTGTNSGDVLVSLTTISPGGTTLSVYNVDTNAWSSRGSPFTSMTEGLQATAISLGADSTPYVATLSSASGTSVMKGTNDGGTTWSALTSHVPPKGLSSFLVAFDDTPLVAWGVDAGTALVSRWSGIEWTSMGSISPVGSTASAVALGLGASRVPFAGWVSTAGTTSSLVVDAWNGSGWTPLGQAGGLQQDPTSTIGAPVLGIDSKGEPVALWLESGNTQRVFVSTLVDGTTWRRTELSPPCIGTFVLDPEDGVIDVCADTTSRWDGVEWIPLGNTLPVADYQSQMKVGATSRGWPAVAWMESNGPWPTFKARRFNR